MRFAESQWLLQKKCSLPFRILVCLQVQVMPHYQQWFDFPNPSYKNPRMRKLKPENMFSGNNVNQQWKEVPFKTCKQLKGTTKRLSLIWHDKLEGLREFCGAPGKLFQDCTKPSPLILHCRSYPPKELLSTLQNQLPWFLMDSRTHPPTCVLSSSTATLFSSTAATLHPSWGLSPMS